MTDALNTHHSLSPFPALGGISVTRALPFALVLFGMSLLGTPVLFAQPGGGGGGGVSVTPDGSTTPDRDANTTGYSAAFTVKNTGTSTDEFSIGCHGTTGVTCTGPSTWVVTLLPNAQTTVYAYYNVGSPGNGKIYLTAFSEETFAQDNGYWNVPIVSSGPPDNWDLSPYNYDNQDMSRCAAGCFAATTSFSTVPYFSLDTPRNITLAYHGDRVYPKPFIHLNVQKPNGISPNQVWLNVKRGEAYQTFTNGSTTAKFTAATNGWQRIGAQLRDSTLSTGVYDIEIILTWKYGTTTLQTQSYETKLMVVNETNSHVALGWTIAGVQRAYAQADGSVLITEGDGSGVYFEKAGSSFVSPAGDFSKVSMAGAGWKRAYPDSTVAYFNSAGLQDSIVDKFGNKTRFTYSSSKLQYVYDPYGDYLYLTYNSDGLSSVRSKNYVGAYKYRHTYFYPNSTTSALDSIMDPDSVLTRYTYDSAARLATVKDRNGNTTTLAYSGNGGKLESITAPSIAVYPSGSASPETEFEPWQLVGVAFNTSVQSIVRPDTVYGRVEEPGGAVTRFTVGHFGQPLATTNALSQTTTLTYDDDGLPVKTVYPNAGTDSTKYNSNGMPIYTRAVDGATTNIAYHSKWVTMPTSVSGTNRPTIANSINYSTGTVTYRQVGSSSSRRTYFYYDSRGRQYRAVSAESRLLGWSWFSGVNGNTSKDSIHGSPPTTYGYDNFGRRKWSQTTGEKKDSVQYDLVNRVTKSFSGGITSPTEFTYDSLYLVKVTDPEDFEHEYSYNALGWLVERTDPADNSDTYAYSQDGELNRWINRRGDSTLYVYDDLHRMTQRKYLMGTTWVTDTLTYYTSTSTEWVRGGNPHAIETTYFNDNGTRSQVHVSMAGKTYDRYYKYFTGGLIDSVRTTTTSSSTFYNRRYRYNTTIGTLDSLLLNGYATTFGYDNDLVVTSVKYPGSDMVSHTRTALAKTSSTSTEATYETAIWRGMAYDGLGRIAEHMYRDEYEALWSNEFAYDSVGRVAADTAYRWYGTEDCDDHWLGGFYCDEQSGYWGAVYPRDKYEYDAVGNRKTAISDYDTTTNRIKAFAGCSYSSDEDGNITSRHSCTTSAPNVTFSWTSDNRLYRYKVMSGDTVTVDLRYDAFGRLVRKYTHGTLSKMYLWDGDNLFAELNASGNKILEYSHYGGLDNLHAVIDGDGEPYFAHKDGMGSVIALTDRLRNVEEQYTYERIWGGLSLDTLSSCTEAECNRSKYKGALHIGEEAGIYYMRNRWYEPHTGRFLSEDPIGLAGGINLYAYVGADPVNGRDPSGLYLLRLDELPPDPIGGFYDPHNYTPAGFNPNHTDGVWFNPWGGNWGGGSSYGGGADGGGYGQGSQDLCSTYDGHPIIKFMCNSVTEPGERTSQNICAGECLQGEWLDMVGTKGRDLNVAEAGRYVILDHINCYHGCKYTVFDFVRDFFTSPSVLVPIPQTASPGAVAVDATAVRAVRVYPTEAGPSKWRW